MNPSCQRDSFFRTLVFLFLIFSFPVVSAQGISGQVFDALTGQPVPGATVEISANDSLLSMITCDQVGGYSFSTSFAGRVTLLIEAKQYDPVIQSNILLDGYTRHRFHHQLTRSPINLPPVEVISYAPRDYNAGVSTIPSNDYLFLAGYYDDPVRIAHGEPGVVLLNDQANHFTFRGQSPVFNKWYLEGLEIVNPSHTNNAGTLSDLPTAYGGGINLFSAQTLDKTELVSGVGPMLFTQSAGLGVNMHLHASTTPEWRAKAGLIGFEAGGGIQSGQYSMTDINLRYSFTGLLTGLGADFGGERIGFYDVVASYQYDRYPHSLKAFGWAGRSTNYFDRVEDRFEREAFKDFFDIRFENDVYGGGLRYDRNWTDHLRFSSGAAYSILESSYTRNGVFGNQDHTLDLQGESTVLSSFASLALSKNQFVIEPGFQFSRKTHSNFVFNPFLDESDLRIFIQGAFPVGGKLKVEPGADLLYSFLEKTWIPGYRLMVRYQVHPGHSIRFASRLVGGEPVTGIGESGNERFLRGLHVDLNYSARWLPHEFGVTFFYSRVSNQLVLQDQQSLHFLADYPFVPTATPLISLGATGLSEYIGGELNWEYQGDAGWRFQLNQSLYSSRRGFEEGLLSEGRYNGTYATHLTIAKEWFKPKQPKNRIWNFAGRILWNGGLHAPEIDIPLSDELETTIFKSGEEFNISLPDFFRIDATFTRTVTLKSVRWRWSLDIQNVFGLSNTAYQYYDPFTQQIETQKHLGVIPILSVQASW